ncbi:MAG: hypothetical protein WAM62_06290 [Pseudolabrys sp.]
MATAWSAFAPRALGFNKTAAPEKVSSNKPSFFTRFVAAMMVARTRQAEREIERYLRNSGGKFTDESEREIERRFLANWQNR